MGEVPPRPETPKLPKAPPTPEDIQRDREVERAARGDYGPSADGPDDSLLVRLMGSKP